MANEIAFLNNWQRLIRTVCTVIISTSLLILPWLYELRIDTNIFRFDTYIFWLCGCLCWLYYFSCTRLHIHGENIPVILFFVLVIIEIPFQTDYDQNSIFFLLTAVAFTGVVSFIRKVNEKTSKIILYSLLCSVLLQLAIGSMQAIKNSETLFIKGKLANSGVFANYILSISGILFSYIVISTSNILRKTLATLLLSAIAFLIVATLSRSALIGLLAGAITIIIYKFRHTRVYLIFSLVIVTISLSIIYSISFKNKSSNARLTIYEVSGNIIKDHPLTGVGPNRFGAVYNFYQSKYFSISNRSLERQMLAENVYEAFNSILQVMVEYGIIGLILCVWYLVIIVNHIRLQWKTGTLTWIVVGCIGSLAALFVASMFSNPFHSTPILLICAILFGNILVKKTVPVPTKQAYITQMWVTGLISIVILIYAGTNAYSEKYWKKAATLSAFGNYQQAEPLYEKASRILNRNGNFLYNYGAESFINGDIDRSRFILELSQKFTSASNVSIYLGNVYEANGQLRLAEEQYLQAIHICPSHIYPKYLIIKLYKKQGFIEKAKYWATNAINFPMKVDSDLYYDLLDEIKKEWMGLEKRDSTREKFEPKNDVSL